MQINLSNRARWVLASIILTISALTFVIGWTSPFIQVGWFSLPIVKVTFPLVVSAISIILFFLGLIVLRKTIPPTLEKNQAQESV
jgi:hypothetical protein